jgi:hypothetical protein
MSAQPATGESARGCGVDEVAVQLHPERDPGAPPRMHTPPVRIGNRIIEQEIKTRVT